MENENVIVKTKTSKGVIVILTILIIMVLGLASYIIYDKFISNTNSNTNTETTEKVENNNINNNDTSSNINLSEEDITKFLTDIGTQPLLGLYFKEPKEIIKLKSDDEYYPLSGMRAMEYCVEQTQSGTSISDEEKNELSKKYNKDFNYYDDLGNEAEYTFNSSAYSSTIQKIFEEKTGYKLSSDEVKELANNTHYLEKYDKYYYWVSDAFAGNIKVNSITKENDLYKVNYTMDETATATLKYNTITKKINIISNQK